MLTYLTQGLRKLTSQVCKSKKLRHLNLIDLIVLFILGAHIEAGEHGSTLGNLLSQHISK